MRKMKRFSFLKKKDSTALGQKENMEIDWPDHVLTLDGDNFDEFIEKYPLSIVDFWAPWCAPCKIMLPRLRKLSKIYHGKVAFGRLNIVENEHIAKKYRIASIPNLIFFSYGRKIKSITGVKSVGEIKKVIDKMLRG